MTETALAIPRIAFMPANIDGCALYRMYIPHINIPGSRFVFKIGGNPWEMFKDAQVVVVQRQVTEQNYQAIMSIKNAGIKIIYDTDDDLWSLVAANPSKKVFDQLSGGFIKCAMACDLITVSTRGAQTAVKSALSGKEREILICPNAMDFKIFNPPQVTKDENKVVIGWAGSNTHSEDVQEAWAILPELMEEFPNLHMEFIGMAPPVKLFRHPRVRLRRYVATGEYPTRLATWAWDITLAPLAETRFNRSKSNIKLLESAALGIPCLVSDVQAYGEFCSLGKLNWLICRTSNDWRTKMRELISSKSTRDELAAKMKRTTQEWFDIETLKNNWIHAAGRALCG